MKPRWKIGLGLVLLVTGSPTGLSSGFTTAEVVAASVRADCVDWRIRGVCLKLQCGLFGCRVRSRPWIEHRLPDLVVTSYNTPGQIPWAEARVLMAPVLSTAVQTGFRALLGWPLGGGHSDLSRSGQDREGRGAHRALRHKEVSVIGHPALAAWRQGAVDRFAWICPSDTVPMQPYFASELDARSWRIGVIETWLAAQPTQRARRVGSWSPLYPRGATVHQPHDVLAAAVTAQRAVDIVTRPDQPHRYQPVPGIAAAEESTDRWQMVHPRAEDQCHTFGQDPDYFAGRENLHGEDEGSYGWLYWAAHQCCPGPGRTLARIAF